ncbi:MAG: FliG C-terminal domain-containing protein [Pseudomonadota bacterium]
MTDATLPVPVEPIPLDPEQLVPKGPVALINGVPHSIMQLTNAHKAAIIIAALGPDQSAAILQALGESNVRRFARIVTTMGVVPSNMLEQIITQFLNEMGGAQDINGGLVATRRFLEGALDREAYERIMEELQGMTATTIWDRLGKVTVGPLANFIAGEHPQAGAVILSRLRADRAARILERLPANVAQTIVLRMKHVPRIDSGVLETLRQVIEEEFLSVMSREQGSKKPAVLLAGLMNHVSGAAREQFLADLESDEPEFAAEVQRVMFTFADIAARLNPRDVASVTRGVDEDVLMTALKTGMETDPPVVEFVLGNLAKRLSERMSEDLEAMQAPPLKEGETAQAEIIKVIQEMARKGEIKLIQPEAADDD